jgi:thymidylate synthase
MHVINVRNVHDALPEALRELARLPNGGVQRETRNGAVRMFPMPVTTVYSEPTERVMFHPERDCNPFFHLYESLWMLAGRRDVKSVAHYVKRMADFSDDGVNFHAAYGYRWRKHFKFDQISRIIKALSTNPDDRRCVLQMWDAKVDLGQEGKDFPCNTIATFSVNWLGKVDMTVFNRSNDIVWGAYGANAVHFSMLQEYIAASIGRETGMYFQVSTNFHGYLQTLEPVLELVNSYDNPYKMDEVKPFPIMTEGQAAFDLDLSTYLARGPIVGFSTAFFRKVVTPMHWAHEAYKAGGVDRFINAMEILNQCEATDWRRAAMEWIIRRQLNAQRFR